MARNILIFITGACFFAEKVSSIAFDAPEATATIGRGLDLRSIPAPTPRAILAEAELSLLGRDLSSTVCGYADGNSLYPFGCVGGYVCATEVFYSAAGCCDPIELNNCLLPTTCIPYGYECDEFCLQENVAYTSCGALYPYCVTEVYNFGNLYYGYICATEGGVVTIEPAIKGAAVTQYVEVTITPSASAVADNGSGGVTNIYYGNNNCGNDSNCGSGNNNGGSGNSNTNEGSGNSGSGSGSSASATVPLSRWGFRWISIICAFNFLILI